MTVARDDVDEQTPLLTGDNTTTIPNSNSTVNSIANTTSSSPVAYDDDNQANQQVGRLRGVFIILSLWALIFLQASNISVIAVTQSIIAEELDAFTEASWFTSAYLIAMSSFAPLVGRLATIFSPRSCIFSASILFSLGGLVTAFAPSLAVFLLGRALSGVAGAGIMTISFVLVLELSGRKRRGLFIGLTNTGFTTGVALGAVLAGAVVNATGWRFLFWVQSPLAVVAGVGIFFSIPKHFTSGPKGNDTEAILSKLARIDYLGAVGLTLSIVLFLFGLSSPEILWLPILLSFVVLPCFIYIEVYVASDPIIPVSVLRSRGALLSCVAQLGIMAARWMILFYTPVYALSVRGWSPASAGSILVPTNLGFATGGLLAGAFHIRRAGSFWTACIISYASCAATLLLLAFLSSASTPAYIYILATFLNGLFTGAALNYTLAHVLHLTAPETHYIVTSLLNTFRGFAGSFGSAIGGGFFLRVLKSGLETGLPGKKDLIRRLLGSPALVHGLIGSDKDVAIAAYSRAIRTLFIAGSVVAFVMVVVQAGTGWEKGQLREDERHVGIVRGEMEGMDEEEEEEEDGRRRQVDV